MQKLRKEDQLPFPSHRHVLIKLRIITPSRRTHRPRVHLIFYSNFRLTLRVTQSKIIFLSYPSYFKDFTRQLNVFYSRF